MVAIIQMHTWTEADTAPHSTVVSLALGGGGGGGGAGLTGCHRAVPRPSWPSSRDGRGGGAQGDGGHVGQVGAARLLVDGAAVELGVAAVLGRVHRVQVDDGQLCEQHLGGRLQSQPPPSRYSPYTYKPAPLHKKKCQERRLLQSATGAWHISW